MPGIAGSRCFAKLPELERMRVEMLHAMATREAARAGLLAEKLLDSDREWLQADKSQLLFIAVSGRLASNDVAGAKARWAKNGKAVESSQLNRLAVRLLLSWIDPDYRGRPEAAHDRIPPTRTDDLRHFVTGDTPGRGDLAPARPDRRGKAPRKSDRENL